MKRKQRYEGKGVTVTYDPNLCEHAAECVRGLPKVFDTSRRKWIDPDAAEPQRVIEVVGRCPTGALQVEGGEKSESASGERPAGAEDTAANDQRTENEESTMSERNQVQIAANGPAIVSGTVKVATAAGEIVEEGSRVALCRCGESSNKPFCDGSHKDCGFDSGGR